MVDSTLTEQDRYDALADKAQQALEDWTIRQMLRKDLEAVLGHNTLRHESLSLPEGISDAALSVLWNVAQGLARKNNPCFDVSDYVGYFVNAKGELCALVGLIYTVGVVAGITPDHYDRRYCYGNLLEAYGAALDWLISGDSEPKGYIKQK